MPDIFVKILAFISIFDIYSFACHCNMSCKTAGIEWADYFLNWQMSIYWALLPTMLITMYFTQKYWDKKEGVDPGYVALQEQFRKEAESEGYKAPKIYALLTLLPLIILLTFNPIVIGRLGINIKVGIPTAVFVM